MEDLFGRVLYAWMTFASIMARDWTVIIISIASTESDSTTPYYTTVKNIVQRSAALRSVCVKKRLRLPDPSHVLFLPVPHPDIMRLAEPMHTYVRPYLLNSLYIGTRV